MELTDLVVSVDLLSYKEGVFGNWDVKEGDCVLKGEIIGKYKVGHEYISSNVTGIVRKLEKEGETYKLNQRLAILEVPKFDRENSKFNTEPIKELIYELNKLKEREETVDPESKTCQLLQSLITDYRKILLKMFQNLQLKKNFQSGFPRFEFDSVDEMKRLLQIKKLDIHKHSLFFPKVLLEINSFKTNQIPEEYIQHNLPPYISAKSVSTYPFNPTKQKRDGDPICDKYRLLVSPNCTIIGVADGCNWGKLPQEAATRATKTFVDFLSKNRFKATNTQQLAQYCLQGLQAAHNSIIHKKFHKNQVGTTTILGGILVKLEDHRSHFRPLSYNPQYDNKETIKNLQYEINSLLEEKEEPTIDSDFDDSTVTSDTESVYTSFASSKSNSQNNLYLPNPKWCFISANIGDCKAYLWKSHSKEIIEISENSRSENPSDPTDCGGRIGPYIDCKSPDLRNLSVDQTECEEGDLIFICSDGIYDNFDPELIGKSPTKFGYNTEKWSDLTVEEVCKCKSQYQLKKFLKIFYQLYDDDIEDINLSKYNQNNHSFDINVINTNNNNNNEVENEEAKDDDNNNNDDKVTFESNTSLTNEKLEKLENETNDNNIVELNIAKDLIIERSQSLSDSSSSLNIENLGSDIYFQADDTKNEEMLHNNNYYEKEVDVFSTSWVTTKLVNHCFKVTKAAREYLIQHNRKLPKDYQKYPGKMDHTTVIAIRVGEVPINDIPEDYITQIGCTKICYQKNTHKRSSHHHSATTKRSCSMEDMAKNTNTIVSNSNSAHSDDEYVEDDDDICLNRTHNRIRSTNSDDANFSLRSVLQERVGNNENDNINNINIPSSSNKSSSSNGIKLRKPALFKRGKATFPDTERKKRRKSGTKKIWDQIVQNSPSIVRSSSRLENLISLRSNNL